jgi:hypothetical protein
MSIEKLMKAKRRVVVDVRAVADLKFLSKHNEFYIEMRDDTDKGRMVSADYLDSYLMDLQFVLNRGGGVSIRFYGGMRIHYISHRDKQVTIDILDLFLLS